MVSERTTCQNGTPKGMRAIITIGDVNGIIEPQNDKLLLGYWNVCVINISPSIKGIVIGMISCCVSVSFSTADPMAANIDAYNKYPPKKNKINVINMVNQGTD